MATQSEPFDQMPVHDEYLPEDLFADFTERMPEVCVELVLETEEGILVAKREIEPQVWFWPGSRLYKGEELREAAHRVAAEELGIEIRILDQLGTYSHFWAESSVAGSPSRHTVNIVYHVAPLHDDFEISLDEHHSEYRFLTTIEPDLHEYVRRYLRENDLV